MRKYVAVVVAALAGSLAAAAPSQAAPPPNDDRAGAASIPTFPATVTGTTAEATVERLDPQVSQCGRIEGTSWYSIAQSPDGTIVLGLQGQGLAPVIRVYRLKSNGIAELDCAAANAGQRAQVAFESVRGATFLVVVGRKPSTADSAFALDAQLFLPPLNDASRSAQAIAKLPATLKGSTLGATTDANDPKDCSIAGGTVWYTVAPGSAARIVLRLHAAGDLDASVVVRQKVRSEVESVACGKTDKKGNAVAAVDVQKGAQYLVAVGQRQGSAPGDFTLEALAAQAAERAPGRPLPAGGVRSSVNGLTDVNDMWYQQLNAGTTYRIAFSSRPCATLAGRSRGERITIAECSAYTTFTPAPDEAGRYVFEVVAPHTATTASYRLRFAPAGEDDLGVGLELPNLGHVRGTLQPSGVDVADLYHFDVSRTADVRLTLTQPAGRSFSLLLVTDSGSRVSNGGGEVHRNLAPGRYVVAVHGAVGSRGGGYRLALVIRQLTSTSITASSSTISPGSSVALRAATSPAPDGGSIEIRIDRFDPLTGWHFNRVVRVAAGGGSVSWTPPAQGRWRARASFAGTLRYSPSESGYTSVLVQRPTG